MVGRRHIGLTAVAVAAGLAVAGCAGDREVHPMQERANTAANGGSTGRVVRTDAEWRQRLTPEQYRVTRLSETERPFTGAYWNHAATGLYVCVCCELPLFASSTKFESGCGWPSFWDAAVRGHVAEKPDTSHGMVRTEIVCARCDAHLGHVFDDGPPPTGRRYCLNSAALRFVPGRPGARDPAPATAPGGSVPDR